MGTHIEEDINPIWFIIGLCLLLGAIAAVIAGHPADVKLEHDKPCAVYEQRPLKDVPARCITSQGGFKP